MDTIRRQAMDAFSSTHLTMVSLIQAIALEMLVARVQGLSGLGELGVAAAVTWLQIVLMFLLALGTWITFAIVTTAVRRVTRFADSVAVFGGGVWQFVAIGWIGAVPSHYWLCWLGLGSLLGIAAYRMAFAAARQASQEPANECFNETFPKAFAIWLSAVSGLVALLGGVFVHVGAGGPWLVVASLSVGGVTYSLTVGVWARWWQRAAVTSLPSEPSVA